MTLAIVTPSYAPDFERFRTLHNSVCLHAPADVLHHVLVPPPDVKLFSSINSSRLNVLRQTDVLPPSFIPTTPLARIPRLPRGYRIAALNLRRPWLPIRGWILQQLVKLSFVASLDVDVAIILDSDLILVRDLREDFFRKGDAVRHYRVPHGLNLTMKRHIRWRESAAHLLDIDSPSEDYADYVAGLMSWSPRIVRAMLSRLESVSSRHWATTLGSQLEFSEYILYGEYLHAFGSKDEREFNSPNNLCHTYWGPEPLTKEGALNFLSHIPSADVAILIQSNTNTPGDVLQFVESKVKDTILP